MRKSMTSLLIYSTAICLAWQMTISLAGYGRSKAPRELAPTAPMNDTQTASGGNRFLDHTIPQRLPSSTFTGQIDTIPTDRPIYMASKPRGSNNLQTREAAIRGTKLHAKRLPEQLQKRYPQTQFSFAPPGKKGQDVTVVGGKHPSKYANSRWPAGLNHGDFKPNTPGGRKTFRRDQQKKWKQPTHMLPYNPKKGKLHV